MARRTATATDCPPWCGRGHHCTAGLGSGTHASTPEVWRTGVGRVVATRYGRSRGGHVELRIVIKLPEDEGTAVGFMRRMIAAAYYLISKVAYSQPPSSGSGSSEL